MKADIDSGATANKVAVFDLGLSPLGTDDEAAGTPPEPHRIQMARAAEKPRRWFGGPQRVDDVHEQVQRSTAAFLGFIVVVAFVIVGGIVLVGS